MIEEDFYEKYFNSFGNFKNLHFYFIFQNFNIISRLEKRFNKIVCINLQN